MGHLYLGTEGSLTRVQFWKRGKTGMMTNTGVHITFRTHIRKPLFPPRLSFPLLIIYLYFFTFAVLKTSILRCLFCSLRYESPSCSNCSNSMPKQKNGHEGRGRKKKNGGRTRSRGQPKMEQRTRQIGRRDAINGWKIKTIINETTVMESSYNFAVFMDRLRLFCCAAFERMRTKHFVYRLLHCWFVCVLKFVRMCYKGAWEVSTNVF